MTAAVVLGGEAVCRGMWGSGQESGHHPVHPGPGVPKVGENSLHLRGCWGHLGLRVMCSALPCVSGSPGSCKNQAKLPVLRPTLANQNPASRLVAQDCWGWSPDGSRLSGLPG